MSKEDLANTSTSSLTSPPAMKPPNLPFSPIPSSPNDKNFRESIMSSMSQYSGLPVDDPVTKVHMFASDNVKYVTDEKEEEEEEEEEEKQIEQQLEQEREYQQEHEETQDEDMNDKDINDDSSIKLGKLKTKATTKQEVPNMTYVTTVKNTIPARSSRRPVSVPPDTLVYDHPSPQISTSSIDIKRRSIQINDDLTKLMHDAQSISSQELKPSVSAQSEPIHIKPLEINKSRGVSLPPRPTLDDIRRARDFSNNLKQKGSEESQEYYDIEPEYEPEPEVKSKGKSVHRSITHKKKKHKKKDKLPFSYNTLINLLQSMNGTIIGQEFNQLDLPQQEKQLISQIIDSLSKLTSDMVIDESRYEIGIKRLQNALNVLEGFT